MQVQYLHMNSTVISLRAFWPARPIIPSAWNGAWGCVAFLEILRWPFTDCTNVSWSRIAACPALRRGSSFISPTNQLIGWFDQTIHQECVKGVLQFYVSSAAFSHSAPPWNCCRTWFSFGLLLHNQRSILTSLTNHSTHH